VTANTMANPSATSATSTMMTSGRLFGVGRTTGKPKPACSA
jgi:hypothetical protein